MNDELKAFRMAMRCHWPDATPAQESIAWALWRSAWSEALRTGPVRFEPSDHQECEDAWAEAQERRNR